MKFRYDEHETVEILGDADPSYPTNGYVERYDGNEVLWCRFVHRAGYRDQRRTIGGLPAYRVARLEPLDEEARAWLTEWALRNST